MTCKMVMSRLPFFSKPGRCSATVSVKRKWPRSASCHMAAAVMTLVLE
jgi:hypothetical protein